MDLREFVAEDLWLLIGIVTFALLSIVGTVGLEPIAGLIAIVGWFLLTPIFLFWGEEIADALFDEESGEFRRATADDAGEDDAIAELKRRYAAGEIDDAEFERRLERLVGVDDALEGVFSDGDERMGTGIDTDLERTDREQRPEREWQRDRDRERERERERT
ncbi:hypothetical protein C446_17806 [Halobiforma nitratireducens JCM 10879]|uniref:SHOCT domain-containing protein n=2 Tax=Halobiforma nitratireducens TaxID=130048 RepID=M0L1N9_9EURY|nr:hypothetical protein C446_17806 [Halobiforma nitratireducens JCM 10879]